MLTSGHSEPCSSKFLQIEPLYLIENIKDMKKLSLIVSAITVMSGQLIAQDIKAKDVPDADNYPISILLLAGLTDTFRCEEQTRRVVRPGVEPAEQQPRQAIHRKHRGDTSKQPTGHPRKARP